MKHKQGKRHNRIQKILKTTVALAVMICIIPVCSLKADADTATDTLSIKVGYIGMELSEYVEAGQKGGYSWVELMDLLPMQENAYSYFQSSYDSYKEYTAIVDSARGFYIKDILELAKVNFADVQSLKFYVEDHKGIQAAFDKNALFGTRYYYEDLSGHRRVIYDENDDTKIVGFDFEEAKSYAYQVEPILAIEDNWAQFNEEIEHIGPDFEYMTTSTRFRLLFGQTSPTESLTSSSAKYVSCVYITLKGKPEVGEIPELNGEIGSHQIDVKVKSDDESVRNALDQLMNISSSDENVMKVVSYEVIKDRTYSDMATVRIRYDIVGEGSASLSVGVGHGSGSSETTSSGTVVGKKADDNPGDDPKPDDDDPGKTPEDNPEDKPQDDPEDNPGGKEDNENDGDKKLNGGASSAGKTENTADGNKLTTASNDAKQQVQTKADTAKPGVTAFALSDEAAAELNEAMGQDAIVSDAEEEITKLTLEDNSEEEKKKQRMILLLTGLGCLGIGISGGAAELISFRIRTRGKIK